MKLSIGTLYIGMVLKSKDNEFFVVKKINGDDITINSLDTEINMKYNQIVISFEHVISNDNLETLIEETEDEF